MRPALLLAAGVLVTSLFVAAAAIRQLPPPALFGFSGASAAAEARTERQFLALPSPDRLRDANRFFAEVPHPAGSERDRLLAAYIRDRFLALGLEDVTIARHDVLLPWPQETTVEMVAPRRWKAPMVEDPIPGDPYTQVPPSDLGIPYHAYSANGDVTAPVAYAGSGSPEDFDRLAALGVDIRGKIALVRYSVPYSYRGFKAFTAQQRGAAGILIYSDPADDGAGKGAVYPDGPWGPPGHIQRGGIVYDFLAPGDPLTPGWPSTPGARRLKPEEAISLPAIVSAPLSARDAQVLLEAMGGVEAPASWKGALPIAYRIGGGPLVVRLRVQADNAIRPVWTVTGLIRGSERPDQTVIVGNHRDAWVYGGVDPSSGSAALMELAGTLSTMLREGWRPRRSILFASWDAEEFALTSSTEWGEEHAAQLDGSAVAYVGVDSAASGRHLTMAAVPVLNRLVTEAAGAVRDPLARIPLSAAFHDTPEGDTLPGASRELVSNRLGSGSDYSVFLNRLGIPVADLSFRGPYGVYHSAYDTHDWVARFGDPGFRYHAALVQLWGLIAIRLAGADVLPFDYAPYAARIDEFLTEVTRDWRQAGDFDDLRRALTEFGAAASAFNTRRALALDTGDDKEKRALDRQLMRTERAFLDPDGLPGRPWYRHLIFAPAYSYAPEVLPGVREAVESGDRTRILAAAARLAAALRQAANALRSG